MRKQTGLKLLLCFIAVIAVFLVVAVSWLIKRAIFDTVPQTVLVSNVAQPWEHNFSNLKGSPLRGNLRVEIRGRIDGSANIYCAGIPINLTAGDVDTYINEPEYWGNSCDVRYEPTNVTTGRLSISVIIGLDYKRPTLNDQGPANYTGGWFTYYPDAEQKYCDGFYFQGKKNGVWTYFDKNGKIIRTEAWKLGVLEH
jgi:hypothetical protein